jgi:hypothetical protein
MIVGDVMPWTEATDTPGALTGRLPSERVVPVWLSLDDLDVIDQTLRHFAATSKGNDDVLRHVGDLQNHFRWVLSEFGASSTAA